MGEPEAITVIRHRALQRCMRTGRRYYHELAHCAMQWLTSAEWVGGKEYFAIKEIFKGYVAWCDVMEKEGML